ncbi:MAG: DNA topoisomerase IB [Chitinophagales bacterium]|nr:DNA topoisomerase IB [Chitinophagales bacterium]
MAIILGDDIQLDKRTIKSAIKDVTKSATAVHLIYVSDQRSGYKRIRNGKIFYYIDGEKKVNEADLLDRFKKLVIPPAWDDVWICKLPNGHLQATGVDVKKRKQYRYHPLWGMVRNHTKFYRLLDFGKQLPSIRLKLEKDLSLPGYPQEKVLAAIVSLLERTNIRIGNAFYEKLYGSFGLTTLKNKHVAVNGSQLQFIFKGKKGVKHNISLKSKKLAKIVKGCQDIPGKELFEFYDGQGKVHDIDSGMVNDYIRTISGGDFTAKDFRTWAGTVHALIAFKELGAYETVHDMKQKIPAALDMVAKQLGNTRTVCKKYYVHPIIVQLYEGKKLDKYINELNLIEENDNKTGITSEEKILMKILETN